MSNEDDNRVYTVRQGKIIEIERGTSSSIEYEHPTRLDAIKSQVAIGATHNFSKEDRELMEKEIDKEANKKGYSILKEHDSSYTIITHAQEEIKNVRELYIFKELQKLEDLNSLERRFEKMEFMGEMNRIDDLRHSLHNELEKVHEDIAYFTNEREHYEDPQRGNDPEKAERASTEIYNRENEFQDLMKIAKKYDVEIDRVHEDLSDKINSRSNETHTIEKSPEISKSQTTTEKKIDFGKIAKQFRKEVPQKSTPQKSRGVER